MALVLSQMYVYPIKSCQALPMSSSKVTFSGLVFDRRYMLVDTNGQFLTGREYPTLCLVEALTHGNELQLTHPNIERSITLNPNQFAESVRSVQVWDDQLNASNTTNEANVWFSELLQRDVSLVYFGELSERMTSRRPDQPVGFADGYPFLLTTESSLKDLNASGPQINDMKRFRPNLVISGNHPFAEDRWKRIKIGDVIFENVKPSERCIFITLDPKDASSSPKGEPLRTLAKFRLMPQKGVFFGVNLVAENEGEIKVGDQVEILEYQDAYEFKDHR